MKICWAIATGWVRSPRYLFSLTALLSLLGLMIGVGTLLVSMAVVSGYETSLKNTIINVQGHLVLAIRPGAFEKDSDIEEVEAEMEGIIGRTPFVVVEGVFAFGGQIAGVVAEGIELETLDQVSRLRNNILQGSLEVGAQADGTMGAVIGRGLAKKFSIEIGDDFRFVSPKKRQGQSQSHQFQVTGIVDLGRYDYDSRYVLVSLDQARKISGLKSKAGGYRYRFRDDELARKNNMRLTEKFGHKVWARDWIEMNGNLFQAVELEKIAIFLILFIIVLAASFNVATTLFVVVVQRIRDVSILRTLGLSARQIHRIFLIMALLLSLIGAALGTGFSVLAGFVFIWLQETYGILPMEVYKLSAFQLETRPIEVLIVFLSALIVCLLASLGPARRAGRLSVVEGLRYQ